MTLKPEDFPTYGENRIRALQGIAQRALLTFGEGQFFTVQNNSVHWRVKGYYYPSPPTTNVNDAPPVTVTTKTPLNDCQRPLGK